MTGADPEAVIRAAFTDQWGRIVSILIGQTGDFELAEECAQEAFAAAWRSWPENGVPQTPEAWLITVARRRAVDRMRRDQLGREKAQAIVGTEPDSYDEADLDVLDSGIADDRLRLLFTCCHPALSLEAQATLALRTLLGLSVAEIAHAFEVSEAVMAKRLTRTRTKIRVAGIPYRVPPAAQLGERTAGVLQAIYLMAGEGYAAAAGSRLDRPDLSGEAVRLAALAAELMPDDPEVLGLCALLMLQQSRASTRTDDQGTLIPLEEQDRSRWDRDLITNGLELIRRAGRRRAFGPYQLQAMIAGCHVSAARSEDTDWAMIVSLYDLLLVQVPSGFVRLNRLVAVAMRDGAATGLDELDRCVDQLPESRLVAAVRADLLRRLGRNRAAAAAYRTAIEHTGNEGERRYLRRRLGELGC